MTSGPVDLTAREKSLAIAGLRVLQGWCDQLREKPADPDNSCRLSAKDLPNDAEIDEFCKRLRGTDEPRYPGRLLGWPAGRSRLADPGSRAALR